MSLLFILSRIKSSVLASNCTYRLSTTVTAWDPPLRSFFFRIGKRIRWQSRISFRNWSLTPKSIALSSRPWLFTSSFCVHTMFPQWASGAGCQASSLQGGEPDGRRRSWWCWVGSFRCFWINGHFLKLGCLSCCKPKGPRDCFFHVLVFLWELDLSLSHWFHQLSYNLILRSKSDSQLLDKVECLKFFPVDFHKIKLTVKATESLVNCEEDVARDPPRRRSCSWWVLQSASFGAWHQALLWFPQRTHQYILQDPPAFFWCLS